MFAEIFISHANCVIYLVLFISQNSFSLIIKPMSFYSYNIFELINLFLSMFAIIIKVNRNLILFGINIV